MRLQIAAVGRLRAGPEAELIKDYSMRFDRTGRAMSLGPLEIVEVEDRKGSRQAVEADLLKAALPAGSFVVALDERGKTVNSIEFANKLSGWRDAGYRDCAFIIGGADGLTKELRAKADFSLSFGPMVWPHMLARVMLVEQLYRAATILAGGPYHRA